MAFLGRRNVGKSSLMNFIIGQNYSIVSDTPGTTTDAVKKRFEMPGTGAVTLIDSAGVDDDGDLGRLRVAKSRELIKHIDFAVVLYSANEFGHYEKNIVSLLRKYDVPFIILHSQSDIIPMDRTSADRISSLYGTDVIEFSCCLEEEESTVLKERFFSAVSSRLEPYVQKGMFEGIVHEGDIVWLVCPIDSEAPEGRLILPQVMAVRDILDRRGYAFVMQPEQMESAVRSSLFPKPDLVVVDSQIFGKVEKIVPEDWNLTSFSILLARSKGPFEKYIEGLDKIKSLGDGDRILILESCSHHSSCDDIGRVKIPALLRKFTGADLDFDIVSGLDETGEVSGYSMVIQCGACMITRRQLVSRLKEVTDAGIPVVNYGMILAYLNGIYERSVAIFGNRG